MGETSHAKSASRGTRIRSQITEQGQSFGTGRDSHGMGNEKRTCL